MSAVCVIFEVNANFNKTTEMKKRKADKKSRDGTEYFVNKQTNRRKGQEETNAYSQLSPLPSAFAGFV